MIYISRMNHDCKQKDGDTRNPLAISLGGWILPCAWSLTDYAISITHPITNKTLKIFKKIKKIKKIKKKLKKSNFWKFEKKFQNFQNFPKIWKIQKIIINMTKDEKYEKMGDFGKIRKFRKFGPKMTQNGRGHISVEKIFLKFFKISKFRQNQGVVFFFLASVRFLKTPY